jgi:hypothetical protein
MKLFMGVALAIALTGLPAGQQKSAKGQELFNLTAHVSGTAGNAAAAMKLQLDSYIADGDRATIAQALKTGGYPAFLTALRKAPGLGQLTAGNRSYTVRWATQTPIKNGRSIVVVTDAPIFFVGGGDVDAKPREGYEVGVIRFDFDNAGVGDGTMAAAARVKPGGVTGVAVDDYGAQPIKVRVMKAYS